MRFGLVLGFVGLLLVGAAPSLAGTPRFRVGTQHSIGPTPPDIWTSVKVSNATADFNADGAPDVIALLQTQAAENLAVLPGDGAGGLRAAILTPLSDAPWPVLTADFDEDGRPDLLGLLETTSQTTRPLAMFLGRRDGTFDAGPSLTVGPYARFAAGDFDRDGHADIAVTHGGSPPWDYKAGHLEIYSGNGRGGMSLVQDIPPVDGAGALGGVFAAADLDRDGDADLLGSDGYLRALLNRGDGTFDPTPIVNTARPGTWKDGVADFDRDGAPDVWRIGYDDFYAPNVVRIFHGRGDGSFELVAEHELLLTGQTNDGLAADFTGDGITDLFAGVESETGELLIGRPDGSLAAPVPYLTGAGSLAALDVDRDGHADIVSSGIRTTDVTVVRGESQGLHAPLFPPALKVTHASPGDFNSDGVRDVLLAEYPGAPTYGGLAVRLGQGGGQFGDPLRVFPTLALQSLAVGDLNGDGRDDAIIGSVPADGDNLEIFFGSGSGALVPGGRLNNGSGAAIYGEALELGDLDGDGDSDLVTSTFGPLSVQLNRGDGTFDSPILTGSGGGSTESIVIEDFDGDGLLDVMALVWTGTNDVAASAVVVHRGNGDGTLAVRQSLTLDGNHPRARVGAFDADPLPDLYVTGGPGSHGGEGGLYVLRNVGGVFALQSQDPTVGNAPMQLGDFNGDSRPDLAAMVYDFFTGAVLQIRTTGASGSPSEILDLPAPGDPQAFVAGDFTGSPLPDILVCNFSRPAAMGIYENVTRGVLDVAPPGPALITPRLRALPNPFRGETAIRFASAPGVRLPVRIFDVSGRVVRVLIARSNESGSAEALWDGRDSDGSVVPSGLYFGRVAVSGREGTIKLMRLR